MIDIVVATGEVVAYVAGLAAIVFFGIVVPIWAISPGKGEWI